MKIIIIEATHDTTHKLTSTQPKWICKSCIRFFCCVVPYLSYMSFHQSNQSWRPRCFWQEINPKNQLLASFWHSAENRVGTVHTPGLNVNPDWFQVNETAGALLYPFMLIQWKSIFSHDQVPTGKTHQKDSLHFCTTQGWDSAKTKNSEHCINEWSQEVRVPAIMQMCAHVKDPISIYRTKRVGLTAGGMSTRKHCTQLGGEGGGGGGGGLKVGYGRTMVAPFPPGGKAAQISHALHWHKKVILI